MTDRMVPRWMLMITILIFFRRFRAIEGGRAEDDSDLDNDNNVMTLDECHSDSIFH